MPPGGVGGRATADCMPAFNNPIVMRTCILEASNTELSVNIPCMSKTSLHVHTVTATKYNVIVISWESRNYGSKQTNPKDTARGRGLFM